MWCVFVTRILLYGHLFSIFRKFMFMCDEDRLGFFVPSFVQKNSDTFPTRLESC